MDEYRTCPNCDEGKLVQVAGSEHENPIRRDQLWECEDCGYSEER